MRSGSAGLLRFRDSHQCKAAHLPMTLIEVETQRLGLGCGFEATSKLLTKTVLLFRHVERGSDCAEVRSDAKNEMQLWDAIFLLIHPSILVF
jgi:hypothetical protein